MHCYRLQINRSGSNSSPVQDLDGILDVQFLVVKDNITTLSSMKEMLDNGLDSSIQERFVSLGNRRHSLATKIFFDSQVGTKRSALCFLTKQELQTVHRTFIPPSVRLLERLLKRADRSSLDKETISALKKIEEDYILCGKIDSYLRRFKLTVRSEELRFNHRVQVDTMFIKCRPVIHMVDETRRFGAVAFLRNQSTT